jgi:hypothetical protein
MSDLLAHLFALGSLAAAFGLSGYALERVLFRRARLGDLRPLARAALGVLAWMLGLFGLAAAGLLTPGWILGLALASALAAAIARRRWGGDPGDGDAGAVFAGAALVFTSPFLVLALRPEVSWDASAYHLTLAKRYLAAGGFETVDFNVYAHWPLATELLYAGAMAIQDYTLAKALHYGFGLATLWAAYLGARALHRAESGWLAAPLILANPVLLFELGIAYVDLAYAFFFLCGVLFLAKWRSADDLERAPLWLAGLCGGALAGLKVTGILGAAALGVLVLPRIVARLRAGSPRTAWSHALAFGLPVVLLWLPWLSKAALATGNPVYPLLYDTFGGPDWSAALGEQFAQWQRSIGMGRTLVDYALLPVRVILSGGPAYDHFAGEIGPHWIALVPLAIAFHRLPLARSALAAAGVYFVLWSVGSQQMRFLIPLLPPLALASAAAVTEWITGSARLGTRRRRALQLALLVAATGFALHIGRRPLARAAETLPMLVRQPDRLRAAARTSADRFVDTLPDDARLLLLNTNQGFFLERDYLADSFFEASQIADWLGRAGDVDGVSAALRERGVTHVLVEHRDWGIAWPASLEALLADPERRTPRFRSPDGRFELFELR